MEPGFYIKVLAGALGFSYKTLILIASKDVITSMIACITARNLNHPYIKSHTSNIRAEMLAMFRGVFSHLDFQFFGLFKKRNR